MSNMAKSNFNCCDQFILDCGHSLCKTCFDSLIVWTAYIDSYREKEFIRCPICKADILYSTIYTSKLLSENSFLKRNSLKYILVRLDGLNQNCSCLIFPKCCYCPF